MTPPAGATVALVRDVADSYVRCLVRAARRPSIDVSRARAQHEAYVDALRRGGFEVERLDADEACPDGCFVEDGLVVLDEVAVVTRPGAPSRRAEVERLARAAARHRPLLRVVAPATLDGGDVLRIGRRLYVGASTRSDAAGHRALERIVAPFGYEVVPVPVREALHLKSAATALDERTVLLDPEAVARDAFTDVAILETPPGEGAGANVLQLVGERRLLAARSFERTAARLRSAGYEVDQVDLSEFTAGDAGPTCLSVRVEASSRPE